MAKIDFLARLLEHIPDLVREFEGESDRGVAILGTACLDQCLRQLINSFLIDDSEAVDELLGTSRWGPLGTFSSRIQASYCMGLISEEEYHDLGIIRETRNKVAHEPPCGLSLSEKWVRDKCNALVRPRRLPPSLAPTDARIAFIAVVSLLSILLKWRTAEQSGRGRVVADRLPEQG